MPLRKSNYDLWRRALVNDKLFHPEVKQEKHFTFQVFS